MKWVGYVVGQQAGLLSSVLLPIWFLEGDAVMNETQMASFGRALQPSFTIEYRAYLTEGTKKFPLDKWFCGSYKNYIPDHYQFGYQLAAWSREQYGDDMWSRVAEYGSKYPYTILTTKWALHKYYRTSVNEIARNTLDELTRFWRSQPVEPNSGETLPTPITSYTVYDAPMALNDTTLLALKRDMDKTSRVVAVDPRTGCERRLFWTGSVNTPPVLYDSTLYWTEYRSSTLWEQRVTSRACSYDLRTGRRRTLRERGCPTAGWRRSVTIMRGVTASIRATEGVSIFRIPFRYTDSLTTRSPERWPRLRSATRGCRSCGSTYRTELCGRSRSRLMRASITCGREPESFRSIRSSPVRTKSTCST